jgi:hypothetical protein
MRFQPLEQHKIATFRSANTWGCTASSAAVLAIFTPCSSVPVKKKVSSPIAL